MARLARRYHVPSAVRRTPVRIEPGVALALVADGALLIDVRRRDDRTTPLDGAARIMPNEIPNRLGTLPREIPIVLACT